MVLDDCYNANPTSMSAALETLASIGSVPRLAVVGVMAELAESEAAHLEIADLARSLGIQLHPVGTDLYGVAPGDVSEMIDLIGSLPPEATVLVKGSRVAGLERIVDAVTE
jgi:UDP-N-acetylmuramoyl-tripeptide--D-alanyl-D-alanine ligase